MNTPESIHRAGQQIGGLARAHEPKRERFPNALLEAMSCGCCVVVSSVGRIPELVRSGQNGVLFEPGNVEPLASILQTLAVEDGVRRALGPEAARTARADFSIERNVKCAERLYDSLLSTSQA